MDNSSQEAHAESQSTISAKAGYAAAAVIIIAMTVILRAIEPYFPLSEYPVFYIISVVTITYIYGFGPGVFTLIIALIAYLYLLAPFHAFLWPPTSKSTGWAGLGAYLIGAIAGGWGAIIIRKSRIRIQRLANELARSNAQIVNILDSMRDPFLSLDFQWRLAYINAAAEQVTGRNRDELLGANVWELFTDTTTSVLEESVRKAMQERVDINFEYLYHQRNMWFEVHAYPSAEGLSLFFHDITGRKQAEAARQRLASIVESSDDAIISESLDSIITTWNAGAQRLYGYTAEEAIGKSVSMLIPYDRKDDIERIVQQIVDGQRVEHYRTVRIRKGGEYIDVSLTVSPIKDELGQIIGVSVIARDITQQQRAENALRKSEELLQSILDNTTSIIYVKDILGRHILANRQFRELFLLIPEQVIGKTAFDVFPEDAAEMISENDQKVIETGGPVRFEETLPVSGGQRTYISVKFPLRDPAGNVYAVGSVSTDITELVSLRRTLEYHVVLLQRALAPTKPVIQEGYSVAAQYIPAAEQMEIGGDFYDVFSTADGSTAVLIGDVSGKGVEAASMAAVTRSTVRALAYETSLSGDALTRANRVLHAQQTHMGAFVTVFLAVLDPTEGTFCYSNAGHPPPAIGSAASRVKFLRFGDPPLGLLMDYTYRQYYGKLNERDKLILYTDGITEARRGTELFDLDGVERVLHQHNELRYDELAHALLYAAKEWARGRLSDDTAVVVIERNPQLRDESGGIL